MAAPLGQLITLQAFNELLSGCEDSFEMKLLNRVSNLPILFFFQNEEIFVQLDEFDELDRITQASIGFNYSLTQAQKTF